MHISENVRKKKRTQSLSQPKVKTDGRRGRGVIVDATCSTGSGKLPGRTRKSRNGRTRAGHQGGGGVRGKTVEDGGRGGAAHQPSCWYLRKSGKWSKVRKGAKYRTPSS